MRDSPCAFLDGKTDQIGTQHERAEDNDQHRAPDLQTVVKQGAEAGAPLLRMIAAQLASPGIELTEAKAVVTVARNR